MCIVIEFVWLCLYKCYVVIKIKNDIFWLFFYGNIMVKIIICRNKKVMRGFRMKWKGVSVYNVYMWDIL